MQRTSDHVQGDKCLREDGREAQRVVRKDISALFDVESAELKPRTGAGAKVGARGGVLADTWNHNKSIVRIIRSVTNVGCEVAK